MINNLTLSPDRTAQVRTVINHQKVKLLDYFSFAFTKPLAIICLVQFYLNLSNK